MEVYVPTMTPHEKSHQGSSPWYDCNAGGNRAFAMKEPPIIAPTKANGKALFILSIPLMLPDTPNTRPVKRVFELDDIPSIIPPQNAAEYSMILYI